MLLVCDPVYGGSNVEILLLQLERDGVEFSEDDEVHVTSLKVDWPHTVCEGGLCDFSSTEDKETAACPLTVEGIVPDSGRIGGEGKGFGARDRDLETGFNAACVGCLFMMATWLQICSMSCSWWTCCCCRASKCSRITGMAAEAAFPPVPQLLIPWENWATATLVL